VPQIGDRIHIPKLNQIAQVLSLPNQHREITVQLGTMRLTLPLSDVCKAN
jgi:DNA mismatch repair protein MutS2